MWYDLWSLSSGYQLTRCRPCFLHQIGASAFSRLVFLCNYFLAVLESWGKLQVISMVGKLVSLENGGQEEVVANNEFSKDGC